MNEGLLSELQTQATFVAGKDAYLRNTEDPRIMRAIKNAKALLQSIGSKLESPEISGGTTVNPETVISLFWMVRKARRIYGLTVDFKQDDTCRVSWSSPDVNECSIENLSLKDLLMLDITNIFKDVELSSRRDLSRHLAP